MNFCEASQCHSSFVRLKIIFKCFGTFIWFRKSLFSGDISVFRNKNLVFKNTVDRGQGELLCDVTTGADPKSLYSSAYLQMVS